MCFNAFQELGSTEKFFLGGFKKVSPVFKSADSYF